MILYMILFTHAVIIIWFSIEREVKWPNSSSATFTTSSSVASGDDAIMNSSKLIEQALANHANSSNPMCAALETILAERNNPVLGTRNCGMMSENSDSITPLRRIMSRGWGPSVISYGRSLRHSRRGRKSPMTRTRMCPRLRRGRSSDEANRNAGNDVSMTPSSSRARPTRHHSEGTPGMHFVPEIHIAR